MQKLGGKRAAVELSISTIVIVVLAVSMLILGLVLVKSIFTGAKNVADMSNEQLKNQISTLFGDQRKVVVYPDSKRVDITQGELNGFGIGIKNLNQGSSAGTKFSYEVIVSDPDVMKKCGVTDAAIIGLITTGRAENDIMLASGESTASKVLFTTATGDPLCTVRLRINVKVNNEPYGSELMDVTFKA
jgi:type II secretory pathway pseudopilin PulG